MNTIYAIGVIRIIVFILVLSFSLTPCRAEKNNQNISNRDNHSVIAQRLFPLSIKKHAKLPEKLISLQRQKRIEKAVSIDQAVSHALQMAALTAKSILANISCTGRKLLVPDTYSTIQSGINAAEKGDCVFVRAGTYFEQIQMKPGVMLKSFSGTEEELLVKVQGLNLLLPERTLNTVIDGIKSKPSNIGMINFSPGSGRDTIIDGFTIQNLPSQNHHIAGHAHALNVRGASPIIMNCYIRNNGSTGIGNHVVYNDQILSVEERDYRFQNIKYVAEPFIYNNIIRTSLGRGIGCNHFSSPVIVGNEIFENDDSILGDSGPGIGAKHGASPKVIGNIVHSNPGGGIMIKKGSQHGSFPIDLPSHALIKNNVVYENGKDKPGITCKESGTESNPIVFEENFVFEQGSVGIGIYNKSTGIILKNYVTGSGLAGIAVYNSNVIRLNNNTVTNSTGPGIIFISDTLIGEMKKNLSLSNQGPPYMIQKRPVDQG